MDVGCFLYGCFCCVGTGYFTHISAVMLSAIAEAALESFLLTGASFLFLENGVYSFKKLLKALPMAAVTWKTQCMLSVCRVSSLVCRIRSLL